MLCVTFKCARGDVQVRTSDQCNRNVAQDFTRSSEIETWGFLRHVCRTLDHASLHACQRGNGIANRWVVLADERREPYSSSPSFVREGLRTSMASSVASGESFSSVSASDTMDDGDMSAPSHANTKTRSSSLSALGVSIPWVRIARTSHHRQFT